MKLKTGFLMISCILIIALLPVNVFAAQPQEVS